MATGGICGSPALRDSNLCYWHHKARTRRRNREEIAGPISNPGIFLPTLEDAASVQVAIQEISHAILDRRIDDKRASLLLYAMQLASNNAQHLDTASVDGKVEYLADYVDHFEEDEISSDDDDEDDDEEETDDEDTDTEEGEDGTPLDEPEPAASAPPKKKPSVDLEALAKLEKRLIAKGLLRNAKS